ncbi:MAG: type II secretion system F family protein [Lachnospiraceae bacterium]|nr:type II secretion system F family protein [Lachnospiraceae bacterium]
MFITSMDYILIGATILLTVLWLILYIKGAPYDKMFEALDEKEYPLKELYGMGYVLLEKTKYPFKTKWDKKLRGRLEILYTERYTEYYLRVIYSQIITIDSIIILGCLILITLSGETSLWICLLMFVFASTYYFFSMPFEKIKKRSEELLSDYAEVVTNLALLTNAGMILREAWEQVAYSGEDTFYKEMQMVVHDMNNGLGDIEAFERFGTRCVIPEAKKFAAIIVQGIEKGNSELSQTLQRQSFEVWEQKKQLVKRQGEKAANRLMIPVFMIFGGILVMVIVPIFANLL